MSSPEKDYSFALKVYKDVKGRKKKKRIKEKKKKRKMKDCFLMQLCNLPGIFELKIFHSSCKCLAILIIEQQMSVNLKS